MSLKIRDGLRLIAEGLADMIEAEMKVASPSEVKAAVQGQGSVEPPKKTKKDSAVPPVAENSVADLRKQCGEVVVALCKAKGRRIGVQLLEDFKAKSVPELKDEHLTDFIARANNLIGA